MKLIASITLIVLCFSLMSCQKTELQSTENLEVNTLETIAMPKVSVQLWSVKDALKNDFKQTLKELANMGFDGVEFAGDFGPYKNNPEGLHAFLQGLGLEISAAHVRFSEFTPENAPQSIAFYQAINAKTLVVAYDERAWDETKVDELIAELNGLNTLLNGKFSFGYHNHDQEFNAYKGQTFWDHIAKSTPKDFVLQLDIGWVSYAEKNPIEFIKRYPGQTTTTHIKAKIPKSLESENFLPIIGKDTTDWLAVMNAQRQYGGTKWWVLEQEEYPNNLTPIEAVAESKKGLDKLINQLTL